jgi:hypothetical protein
MSNEADRIMQMAKECASKLATPANWLALRAAVESLTARKWERLSREELVEIWQSNNWQNHSDKNLSDLIQDALIRKNGGV